MFFCLRKRYGLWVLMSLSKHADISFVNNVQEQSEKLEPLKQIIRDIQKAGACRWGFIKYGHQRYPCADSKPCRGYTEAVQSAVLTAYGWYEYIDAVCVPGVMWAQIPPVYSCKDKSIFSTLLKIDYLQRYSYIKQAIRMQLPRLFAECST